MLSLLVPTTADCLKIFKDGAYGKVMSLTCSTRKIKNVYKCYQAALMVLKRERERETELLKEYQASPMPLFSGTFRAFALKGLFWKFFVPSNCGERRKHVTNNQSHAAPNVTAKEKILRSHLIHALYHQNSSKCLCIST